MKRSKFTLALATLALSILTAPLAADAQPTGKVYRIGLLSPGPRLAPEEDSSSPLWAALRDRGWIEGQNLTIERRYDEGRAERLPELAIQLVRLKVDVIWARAPQAAVAAKNATKTIPIVFTGVVDPVALGLVNTLARPGGNVTGVTFATGTEVGAKELEFLREIAPGTTRVAFIYNAGNPAAALYVPALETAGRRLGIEVQSFGVRQPDDYEGAFRRIIEARCEALALIGDPLSLSQRRQIIDFAYRNRLPSVFGFRQFVVDGGLMSYGWYLPEVYGRLAAYLDKILKGAKPADLPVEQPTKFELVINLKTAKALGLTIPQSVLIRADEVIQ